MTMFLVYAALMVKHYYASYEMDYGYSLSRRREITLFKWTLFDQVGLEVILTLVAFSLILHVRVFILAAVEILVYTLACLAERRTTYVDMFTTHVKVELLCLVTLAATMWCLAYF